MWSASVGSAPGHERDRRRDLTSSRDVVMRHVTERQGGAQSPGASSGRALPLVFLEQRSVPATADGMFGLINVSDYLNVVPEPSIY